MKVAVEAQMKKLSNTDQVSGLLGEIIEIYWTRDFIYYSAQQQSIASRVLNLYARSEWSMIDSNEYNTINT